MQFAAKYGLVDFVDALLKANVDPNFSGEYREIKCTNDEPQETYPSYGINCKKYPLFLAAENGHHKILKLFKYHNFSTNEAKSFTNITNDESGIENMVHLNPSTKSNLNVNFEVTSSDKSKTVLHTVLQKPLKQFSSL